VLFLIIALSKENEKLSIVLDSSSFSEENLVSFSTVDIYGQ